MGWKKEKGRQLGKEKHKNPHINMLHITHHEKLEKFKSTCRSKRYFYRQNKSEKIKNSVNDSKTFWKTFD